MRSVAVTTAPTYRDVLDAAAGLSTLDKVRNLEPWYRYLRVHKAWVEAQRGY